VRASDSIIVIVLALLMNRDTITMVSVLYKA